MSDRDHTFGLFIKITRRGGMCDVCNQRSTGGKHCIFTAPFHFSLIQVKYHPHAVPASTPFLYSLTPTYYCPGKACSFPSNMLVAQSSRDACNAISTPATSATRKDRTLPTIISLSVWTWTGLSLPPLPGDADGRPGLRIGSLMLPGAAARARHVAIRSLVELNPSRATSGLSWAAKLIRAAGAHSFLSTRKMKTRRRRRRASL